MDELLLHRTLEVRKSRAAAPKAQFGAEIVSFTKTKLAAGTRHAAFNGNFIAWLQPFNFAADSGDLTSKFMSQAERFPNGDASVATVVVIMQIRATESRRARCNFNLIVSRLSYLHIFHLKLFRRKKVLSMTDRGEGPHGVLRYVEERL